MIGLLGVILSIAAIIGMAITAHSTGLFIAVLVACLNVISFAVMFRYINYPEAAPNSWTTVNFISFIAAIGLLIFSFI